MHRKNEERKVTSMVVSIPRHLVTVSFAFERATVMGIARDNTLPVCYDSWSDEKCQSAGLINGCSHLWERKKLRDGGMKQVQNLGTPSTFSNKCPQVFRYWIRVSMVHK